MEIQLQELLEKIRAEGIVAANAAAEAIKAEAQAKASSIIAEAEREAKTLRDSARSDASRTIESGNAALAQAARDTILSFRDHVSEMLKSIVSESASFAIDARLLEKVLPEVIEKCLGTDSSDVVLSISPATMNILEAGFATELSKKLGRGIEIKSTPGVASGFRISMKNGALQYDFNADSVAEMLARRLNARLAAVVRGQVAGR